MIPARARATTLGVALVAWAATAAAAEPSVTRHSLPNGMVLLVREDPAAAVVAASLQVRAGSRDETRATAGITNLLQRALLRGTTRRSAQELAEAAEDIGGALEASGDVEYGEVRGEALARHWNALLRLIAEVALSPALAPDEVDKERRLVLSQLRTRGDTPFQRALDTMVADLYGAHPYAWPAAGLPESVERVTREALRARYRSIYRADRMVLAVSGRVARARVVKSVERLFGAVPGGSAPAAAPGVVPAPRAEPRVIERSVQQAYVLIGFLGPSLRGPDYAAVRVLGAVLGGGMSGRLFVELREKRGLAYSVGVLAAFRTEPSFLVAYLGTAPPNAEAARAGVQAEIDRIRLEAVSEEELARAKAFLVGTLAMDRRTNARHAWYLAFFEGVGAGWDFPARYARAVEGVSAADVGAVARRYLVRATVVVLRPPASDAR